MKFFIFLSLLFSLSASAAYRVYQLKVIFFDEKNKPREPNKILTTLDPYQYEHYHSGYNRLKIELIDTWFCPGDTHAKSFCKKPKNKLLQRGPAGLFAPKRDEGLIKNSSQ